MEKIERPSTPFFQKQIDKTSVELHLEPQREGFCIISYVRFKTPQGPRVKKAQLQGIPSSVTVDKLEQATRVLQQAIIRCREYLNDPVVEVVPRGLGGMKPGFLLKQFPKKSSSTKHQNKPKKLTSDLPPLIDEEDGVPSNSNTAVPLRQIPLPSIEEVLQQLETFAIPLDTGGEALFSLGVESYKRGDLRSALPLWQQALVLAMCLEDRKLAGMACGNLGVAYDSLGEYRRAIDYHEKDLAIAKELEDRAGEGRAYSGLGNGYHCLGEYRRAIDYHEKDLAIAKELGVRTGEGRAYSGLGNAYQRLGEYRRAIEYHEKDLAIANELGDRAGERRAYGNLGIAYDSLGEYRRAIEYHEKHLAIAKELEDRAGEGRAYGNLGNAYQRLGEYRRAIDYYEKCLAIAKELEDRAGEGMTYSGLGVAYQSLGEYRRAIEYHEKRLAIAKEVEDRAGEGIAHNNLGVAYQKEGNLSSSEEHFRQAVACFSVLQEEVGGEHQGWQISIFEEQSRAYLQLKDVLIAQGKKDEALALADFGRSRALASFVGGSLGEAYIPQAMRIEDMQLLASQLETTFVVIASNFMNASSYFAWVISANKDMFSTELTMADPKSLDVTFQVSGTRSTTRDASSLQMDQWASQLGESAEEGLRVLPKQKKPSQSRAKAQPTFYDKYSSSLQALYLSLIAPLEEYLPEEGGSITILPDTNLQKIPFAALMSDRTHYLIEKWDISTAPSIEVLKLLATRAQKYPANDGKCVLSDPRGHAEAPDLKYASDEAATLVEQLGAEHYAHGSVTKELTTGQAEKAGLIHLVCHGDPTKSESPHSVFRGLLALADGDWYASEIGKMSLKADLVFMSACGTGKGTEMQEGVIGLSRSFLASGANSVIATHWSIQDRSTVPVVEVFYERLLQHGNKAKALREAMLSVVDKWRYHPEKWGAFFLTGLPFVATDSPLQPAQLRHATLPSNSNS